MIRVRGSIRGVPPTIAALSQLPSLLRQAAEAAMRESLELISETARTKYLAGPYPSLLQPRTQRLRASVGRGDRDNIFEVKTQGTVVTGTLGTKVVYARVHEEGSGYLPGGVIKPTRGQYLAIPTDLAKTTGGVVKAEYHKPLRSIPGLYLMRSHRKPGL